MVCEVRRLGGLGPTAADLAFHRRLVAQIKASLRERRVTLEERLKVLIELEHHQQHANEIMTAIYTGKPMPTEEPVLAVDGLARMRNAVQLGARSELPPTGVEPILLHRSCDLEAAIVRRSR